MKLLASNHYRTRIAGLTLLETAIGTLVLSLLLGTILESATSMKEMTQLGISESDLQHSAERALERIVDDLRVSGFVDDAAGLSYPELFTDGELSGDYAQVHAHPAAAKNVADPDPAAGFDRGIVFLAFQDLDGNDIPDIDWAGEDGPALRWDTDGTISYSVRTQMDGTNALVRVVKGGDSRVIARNVERVVFDTTATVGPTEVPLGVVRVRLWFYARNAVGTETRAQAEASIRLRNGSTFLVSGDEE